MGWETLICNLSPGTCSVTKIIKAEKNRPELSIFRLLLLGEAGERGHPGPPELQLQGAKGAPRSQAPGRDGLRARMDQAERGLGLRALRANENTKNGVLGVGSLLLGPSENRPLSYNG